MVMVETSRSLDQKLGQDSIDKLKNQPRHDANSARSHSAHLTRLALLLDPHTHTQTRGEMREGGCKVRPRNTQHFFLTNGRLCNASQTRTKVSGKLRVRM